MLIEETLPYGTAVRSEDGRVVAVDSACGREVASLRWGSGRLDHATLALPNGGAIIFRAGGTSEHPLFGPVDRLCDEDGEPVAFFGQVDWAAPKLVPPLDRPGALPPGAGAAVLNLLSIAARTADVPALQYRGPYATAALFDALLASFFVRGSVSEALQRFVSDVERTAVLGAMVTADVDFEPAPFEWSWPCPGACVQRRDGVERIYVDGAAYERDRVGPRRVILDPSGSIDAVVMIGAERWATVLSLDASGAVTSEPAPLPAAPADLVGESLPAEVAAVLADAVAGRAAGALAPAVREVLRTEGLRWGDPGGRIVARTERGIEIHAGVVAVLPTDASALLEVLLSLIEPVALRLAQTRVAEAHDALTRR
ncbi:MAG: hypothetical protein AAF721_37045 [Myxococcota bacterium]